jgi:hypothetical protein
VVRPVVVRPPWLLAAVPGRAAAAAWWLCSTLAAASTLGDAPPPRCPVQLLQRRLGQSILARLTSDPRAADGRNGYAQLIHQSGELVGRGSRAMELRARGTRRGTRTAPNRGLARDSGGGDDAAGVGGGAGMGGGGWGGAGWRGSEGVPPHRRADDDGIVGPWTTALFLVVVVGVFLFRHPDFRTYLMDASLVALGGQ